MIQIEEVYKKYLSKRRRLRLFQRDFSKENNENSSTKTTIHYKKGLFIKRKTKITHALNGVNFRVKEGEIFGLLGPNGAGKTTLTKIISTLILPDKGSVKVNSFDTKNEPTPVRESIGLVTGGERSLYWKLTPIENLTFFGRLYRLSKKEAYNRAIQLIERFDLTEKKDELVQNLSTGQKMKVAFCRALIHNPPILLVDEAERGLDPRASKEFRAFIKEELQQKQGKTIVLCTHNMEILDELCDRIALINQGSIVALDTPEHLKIGIRKKHILTIQSQAAIPTNLFADLQQVKKIQSKQEEEFHFTEIEITNGGNLPNTILSRIYDEEITVNEFHLKSATLEDVFLKLTGRKITEEDELDD
ncbi:ABC transporter ATP-binding protein [Candidatus Heimdallarchaeota archaeon]|nr:MAG: ABC transporter ATP-binding protein [Candidatus Heimdallarchaeota archaeon]